MSALCDDYEKLGKGIGNANRYRILESLMKGPLTVGEIVEAVHCTQPNVSQNLRVLKSADLVTDERKGQEVYYSLNVPYLMTLLKKFATNLEKCPKSSAK